MLVLVEDASIRASDRRRSRSRGRPFVQSACRFDLLAALLINPLVADATIPGGTL
jgi:hypothetical protein